MRSARSRKGWPSIVVRNGLQYRPDNNTFTNALMFPRLWLKSSEPRLGGSVTPLVTLYEAKAHTHLRKAACNTVVALLTQVISEDAGESTGDISPDASGMQRQTGEAGSPSSVGLQSRATVPKPSYYKGLRAFAKLAITSRFPLVALLCIV